MGGMVSSAMGMSTAGQGLTNPFASVIQNLIGGGGNGTPAQGPIAKWTDNKGFSRLWSDDNPGDARALTSRGSVEPSPYPEVETTVPKQRPSTATLPASAGAYSAVSSGRNEIEQYIIQSARKRGVDPATALKVARAEGGTKLWNRQSDVVKNGKRERSYGPFQLYMDGGLGNKFYEKTGLHPADEAAGRAAIDFAMEEVRKGGWTPWYGAKAVGVGRWDGVGNPGKESGLPLSGASEGDPRREAINSMREQRGMEFPDNPIAFAGNRVNATPLPTAPVSEAAAAAPGRRRAKGGMGGVAGGYEEEVTMGPPEGTDEVDFAAKAYKTNKTTRHLRSLGAGPTIDVLVRLGRALRAPQIGQG